MKKLTKSQQADYNQLREAVEVAIGEANAAIIAANEARQRFEDFRDGIHADIDAYFEEKSEKWQEGDAGSAYSSWRDEWDEQICDEISEIEPDLHEYPMEVEG